MLYSIGYKSSAEPEIVHLLQRKLLTQRKQIFIPKQWINVKEDTTHNGHSIPFNAIPCLNNAIYFFNK